MSSISNAEATSSASIVFPVPGSPLISSGFSSSMAALTAMLKSSVEEFRILDLHAGVIASASDVVISAHSSVIIDALGMNVPTILHQNFTPHWLIRHPEVSSFLKLKNPHSYNEKTLVSELNNFKDKEREVSNIGKTLKHKDNFEVFLND